MGAFTLTSILTLILITTTAQALKCGQRKVSTQKLIANGYKASAGAWPWHGAMFHRRKPAVKAYVCGVTILRKNFVVTAAHCTFDSLDGERLPADRAFVKVGVTDLDKPEHHVQYHDISSIFRHELYDDQTAENDIALLKLDSEINFNDYVQPICLWRGDSNLDNIVSEIGYTVGWGYDQTYGLPKHLNEATMPIVSKKECIESDPDYYRKFYFEHTTFCAGYRNGTSNAPGDSGGGLYFRSGNAWVLRGIVSNAKPDPNTMLVDPKSFIIFENVCSYLNWIRSTINGE